MFEVAMYMTALSNVCVNRMFTAHSYVQRGWQTHPEFSLSIKLDKYEASKM